MRVLPPVVKASNDTRPGQAYLDKRGRVLWVQRVMPQIDATLCFVLNATGGMHRGAFVKRPGTITLDFGETIPAGLDRKEAEARIHAAINKPLP